MRPLRISHIAVNAPDGLVDVPVYSDQVQEPVQIHIRERAPETETGFRDLADSRGLRDIPEATMLRAVQSHHLVIEIGDRNALGSGIVEIGGVDAHAGARLSVL